MNFARTTRLEGQSLLVLRTSDNAFAGWWILPCVGLGTLGWLGVFRLFFQ